MSLRSPLGRVRGLGSAKQGVAHWWSQRITAIALAPLSVWFLWMLVMNVGASHEEVHALIAEPLNAVLLISFLYCVFWHGKLGLQTIIEDYVHQRSAEIALLLAVKFSAFLCAAAGILAVLRIAL